MKLKNQDYLAGNPTRIIGLVFVALLFCQPASLSAQSAKNLPQLQLRLNLTSLASTPSNPQKSLCM